MHRYEPTMDHDDGHVRAASGNKGWSRRAVRDDAFGNDQGYEDEGYESQDYGHEDYGYDDEAPSTAMERLLAAPGKLLASAAALVAFAIVGVNAAYMQPGAHPAPMLSTRADTQAYGMPQTALLRSERAVTMAPAPIVPPSRSYDPATHSASGDQVASLLQTGAIGPRFAAPSPTPRPQMPRLDATTPVTAAPAAPAPPAPLPPVARQVQTIAVTDPIGALLAPVVQPNPTAGTNQPLPRAAITRSAQPVVAAVQAVLADMGYQPGSIDGVIGPSTEEAIRRFQLRRALEPNGQITTDLLEEIERVSGTRISAS